MKTTIIVIGDELLIGQVTDTNSGMIARLMAPHGWEVEQVMTVADDREAIREAVGRALDSTPVVLTTGGLGPTKDDITKAVLTDIFGGELREDPDVLANVHEVVERRGLKLNDLTAAQAIVPTSCRVIQNRVGTAPLMWFERTDGHILVAMPGVPFETREMFSSAVMPMLLQRFPSPDHIEHRTLVVADISESALATRLAPWESALPPYAHLAYLPKPGVVRLRIDGRHTDAGFLKKEIDRLADELALLAAGNLMCRGDITPARCLLDMLVERHLTVGTAESCTGGNIAHTITAEPGSSAAMLGGVVSYSNDVKRRLLGVSEASLEAHGAVSIPVVKEMASGARKALGCDIALATSGIAGPDGAVPGKPVGTVCIAVATPWGLWADTFHFPGNRERVIDRATTTAIIRAIRELQSHP
ncbi:CinA family nicotinamide mononucleotide deamidase-related protein [Paramuribaculum intestinale]|uniref:CinA family nicotinamide mononucleotide deamidase-related protein n=1 Tax=Paramuribaculum intestinale TaxID=2094151 RepID=UPI0025A96E09|nr:CinA family nicotinamide mononucleotide deamidase-related protein [Paramuribaculum intestinale]